LSENAGKTGWLLNSQPRTLAPAHETDALKVPLLKQTGPKKWSHDGSSYATYGEMVTIEGRPFEEAGYYNIVRGDGSKAVVSSLDLQLFDFRKCSPADLLEEHRSMEFGYTVRFIEALPLYLREGARPLDLVGDWIDEKYISEIEYVVCGAWDGPGFAIKEATLKCTPIYKTSKREYGAPTSIYFTDLKDVRPIYLD